MTTLKYLVFVLAAGLVTALNPVPHQTNEESLRSALNAVTRKQRSLNANAQAYYADMPPLNYRDVNPDRKLQRQQVESEDIDDIDQTLAFIPSEAGGQLETIGNGYQHLNNKQFGRALMDYLQYTTDQTAPQSMFRERERSSSTKRDKGYETGRLSDKQLARLLLDNIENNLTDDPDQLEDEEYQRTLEILSNKYRNQMDNNNPYSDDQILLSELLGEEEREQDQDPRYAHYPSAERRNVNARYPLFNRDYNYMAKRFPVSKRSTKASNKKVRQATDPKVAQDLGGLFGTNPTDTDNHTHEHDHDNEHDHEHEHDHDHEHNHPHDHEHDHNHTKGTNHAEHAHDHSASEAPITAIKSKNLKENADKLNKTKERAIEVKKKSVDWSQYFGIDRRKKKAVYTGRPSTQDQDNEYFLQKYYEIMAENLNPSSKDSAEKRNKLQQMDSKLKSMKNLMIEEAVQLGSENNMNSQEVKDEIMSRLSTAYSLEKLRRALNELSNSASAQRGSEKAAEAQNNLTANHPTGSNSDKNDDKRNRNVIEEYQDFEDDNCPEIEIIERRCKATEALVGDFRGVLHIPCVMFHICNSCEQEECLERFAMEIEKICEEEDIDDRFRSKEHCIRTAMILPRYSPSISRSALCEGDSCLSRYQNRYRHRYLYNGPYASSSSHHRDAYNLAASKR